MSSGSDIVSRAPDRPVITALSRAIPQIVKIYVKSHEHPYDIGESLLGESAGYDGRISLYRTSPRD
jgi:hypothetical protein